MDRMKIPCNSKVGKNVIIKEGVIIGENVIIDDDVYLDYGCIIKDNVHIKIGSFIGARSILGEYLVDFFEDMTNKVHPLVIGEKSIIRSETIIYGDTNIGDNFQSGHRVTIREKSEIGNNVRIGTLSDIQGDCIIGNYVNIHSNVHIGNKSIIKDYVWIFPYVILTNDPTPPSETLMGVTVEEFAVIATGTVVLPGVTIKKDTLVAAGTVLNKDFDEERIIIGNPCRDVGSVLKIKNKETGKQVYPWRYTFDRGMPWKSIGYDAWLEEKNLRK